MSVKKLFRVQTSQSQIIGKRMERKFVLPVGQSALFKRRTVKPIEIPTILTIEGLQSIFGQFFEPEELFNLLLIRRTHDENRGLLK